MTKHLKAKVEVCSYDNTLATLTFIEATHACRDGRGKSLGGGQGFVSSQYAEECNAFVHKNVCLACNGGNVLNFYPGAKSSAATYGMPKSLYENINIIVCVRVDSPKTFPVNRWPEIRESIQAYNEFYKDK